MLINDYLKEWPSGNAVHAEDMHTHLEESVQGDYVKRETKGINHKYKNCCLTTAYLMN